MSRSLTITLNDELGDEEIQQLLQQWAQYGQVHLIQPLTERPAAAADLQAEDPAPDAAEEVRPQSRRVDEASSSSRTRNPVPVKEEEPDEATEGRQGLGSENGCRSGCESYAEYSVGFASAPLPQPNRFNSYFGRTPTPPHDQNAAGSSSMNGKPAKKEEPDEAESTSSSSLPQQNSNNSESPAQQHILYQNAASMTEIPVSVKNEEPEVEDEEPAEVEDEGLDVDRRPPSISLSIERCSSEGPFYENRNDSESSSSRQLAGTSSPEQGHLRDQSPDASIVMNGTPVLVKEEEPEEPMDTSPQASTSSSSLPQSNSNTPHSLVQQHIRYQDAATMAEIPVAVKKEELEEEDEEDEALSFDRNPPSSNSSIERLSEGEHNEDQNGTESSSSQHQAGESSPDQGHLSGQNPDGSSVMMFFSVNEEDEADRLYQVFTSLGQQGSSVPWTLQCSGSLKNFLYLEYYQRHERASFHCKTCEDCISAADVVDHKTTHFSCDICAKPFRDEYSRDEHRRRNHTDVNSFRCRICQKRFQSKGSLKKHEKEHACPWCRKGKKGSILMSFPF